MRFALNQRRGRCGLAQHFGSAFHCDRKGSPWPGVRVRSFANCGDMFAQFPDALLVLTAAFDLNVALGRAGEFPGGLIAARDR
jgi:hypothetical protein